MSQGLCCSLTPWEVTGDCEGTERLPRPGPQARGEPEPAVPSLGSPDLGGLPCSGLAPGTPAACFPRASYPRGREAVDTGATRSHGNLVSAWCPPLVLCSSSGKLLGPGTHFRDGIRPGRGRQLAGTTGPGPEQADHEDTAAHRVPGGGGDGGVGQGGRQVQRPRGWHLRLTDVLVSFSPDSSGAFDDILGKSRLGGALTLPPSPDLSSVTQFCLLLPRKHPPFWGSFQKGRSYAAFCLPQHSGIRVPLQLWKLRLENEGPQLRLCRGEWGARANTHLSHSPIWPSGSDQMPVTKTPLMCPGP